MLSRLVRVLHLTPELPYWPGGSGGSTRQFHLLRRLVELGHEVMVVAPATPAQMARVPDLAAAGIEAEIHPRPASRARETLKAVSREPALGVSAATRPVLAWQVSVFWHYLRPLALRVATDWRPDAVVVEHDYAAPWAAALPPALPGVLTFHNLSWRYYEARAAAASGPARAALAAEARRFRRFDAAWLSSYRLAVAMSESDANRLRRLGDTPVAVVPNGVAAGEQPPLADHADPPSVLFTGTLAYHPNEEGIRWFAERAWPDVRRELPNARLTVAGRDPGPAVRALAQLPGVEVAGSVPDMRPYFERATLAVVPILSGGGTRLKVLEAMAARRAVVSTSAGADGLDVVDGEHVLLADEPAAFAASVTRLLRDAGLRERLAGAGRRLVEESYDWGVLGKRLAAALERLTEA